jgi:hypothetical protein
MKTFQEFIAEARQQHGSVNLLFEQGMYSLMDDLERIVTVLRDAKIPFEVIGGVAVNAHLLGVHRSRSFVTRDIDLLVQRHDLQRIVSSAESAGYTGRKIIGGFMLIRPGQLPEEAVHLLFVGEKARSSHPLANPVIHPEEKHLPGFGVPVPVARVRDLVQMKLNSFRPKDEAHLEILDKCGLITPSIESDLPPALKERLAQARRRFSVDEAADEV